MKKIIMMFVLGVSVCHGAVIGKYYRGMLGASQIEMTLEFDTTGKTDGFFHVIGVNRMNYLHGNNSDSTGLNLTDYRYESAKKKYVEFGKFTGKIVGDSITGEWKGYADTEGSLFALQHSCGAGGTDFTIGNVSSDQNFRNGPGDDWCREHCAIQYLEFEIPDQHLCDSLNRVVFNSLIPYDFNDYPYHSHYSYPDYSDLTTEFNLNAWYNGRFDGISGCTSDEESEIVWDGSDIVSYSVSDFIYSGGAHGLEDVKYENFVASTGKQITINDIFSDGCEDALDRKVNAHLDNDEERERGEGYAIDNFFITPDGICFVFNEYVIGCYMEGISTSFIPWSELDSLIDPNGPMGWVRK
ncbi:MAG TPA: DUF3298 domain-containing protein [Bacteroidia bacterium]|jgi:hypothetical protein|nr:DUF3298 domain-containing protein [Bacteroidia bacterium]